MRPTWKGSISFGLVYIPISVYPATREEKLSFRQLRKGDLSPIKYKKVAEADMKEVPADQIVKGFEYEKGRYIVLSDEDFEKVRIESTHSIDITDFVEQEQVDPKFFYKPYFLEAQKGGEKAYALLHKALSGTGKIGIAKVAIANREYLAAVKLLSEGNTLEGFDTLDSKGWVRELGNEQERYAMLAAEYLQALKDKKSVLVVSPVPVSVTACPDLACIS